MEENSPLYEFLEAMGLPLDVSVRFVAELIAKEKLDPNSITVEDLRRITKHYLQEMLNDLPT